MHRLLALLLASSLLALSGACASSPKGSAMVPADLELDTRHPGKVHVSAQGSGRRMLLGKPRLPGATLREAATDALRDTGLFAGTAPEAEDADWVLSIETRSVSKPEMSLDIEAVVELRWVLTERVSGEVRWAATLETTHLANNFDANNVTDRGRIALEGAVSKNVREALVRIARVDL